MMNARHAQSGASLIVSLIMLVILTLLVVSAMRSSNSNLRVAGNMQSVAEATSAAQRVIESTIDTTTSNVDYTTITAATTSTVSEGGADYTVVVAKPVCENSIPLLSDDATLSKNNDDDKLCFGNTDDGDPILDSTGKPVVKQTKCNLQNWKIQATATSSVFGTSVTLDQGVAERKYTPTACP
jgi:hypothetical protein